MHPQINKSFVKLKEALEDKPLEMRFKGYDPFDGLNSPLISRTLLGRSRVVRLIWVQFFKRSPINFRKIVGIKKSENPQALAIFLSSYCHLYNAEKNPEHLTTIEFLAQKIIDSQKKGWSGACWGYPFDWQARAFFQSKNTPLVIPTNYCFNALLDAYEVTRNDTYKDTALTSAEFVINDLNRTEKDNSICFSYSPTDKSVVYNASLMAGQILARSYYYNNNSLYKETALASVKFCINQQKANGSWSYGQSSFHQWIDSFHTAYNLICLTDYANYCNDNQFSTQIERGLRYYLDTFFDKDGFSKYYSDTKYPLDINNAAQLLILLGKMNILDKFENLIDLVMKFTIDKLQNEKGWFHYQINQLFTNRIIYLRWSNSWMFYALSIHLNHEE